MIRRPPRSTLDRSSAASDVYKRQVERARDDEEDRGEDGERVRHHRRAAGVDAVNRGRHQAVATHRQRDARGEQDLSLIHISEPTRPY